MTDRMHITYTLYTTDKAAAETRADDIAIEQTVEVPADVIPAGYIRDTIVGQVHGVTQTDEHTFDARISYSVDGTSLELPQVLNVIFGNSSIQPNICVSDIQLGGSLSAHFSGAKFGVDGVRTLLNRPTGALIAPVIKPQGLHAEALAKIAYQCAVGGADIIKEDHGLADQHMAPFKQRVDKITGAVARANRDTGRNCLYFANVAGNSQNVRMYATYAKDAGAGGILLMPGLFGFDAVWQLAKDKDFTLPIMTHPSFLGPYVLSPNTGFTHAVMFGTMQRLCGSDISVFPNSGGRFGFTRTQCHSIATACGATDGIGTPIFPSPGGGMTPSRIPDMLRTYGQNTIFILGGSIMRHHHSMANEIGKIRTLIDSLVDSS